jgi:secondary thiamine-phosphate synthase enzyme
VQNEFTVETLGPGLVEITAQIEARVPAGSGLLTVFVRHTSCSLLIQENADPDVRRDLDAWLTRLIPSADDASHAFLRHRAEGPDDMPAHLKAALLPVSLQIPVRDGRLMLGTWQGIYLWEHRTHPHRRQIVLHLSP